MSAAVVLVEAGTGRVEVQFEPLAANLLVRRVAADAMSTGGLHIPETAIEKINQAEVVKAGPKVEDSRLVPGVLVVFAKYGGDEILLAHESFLVIREVDLLGFVPVAVPVEVSP